jgi:hypothetical protein
VKGIAHITVPGGNTTMVFHPETPLVPLVVPDPLVARFESNDWPCVVELVVSLGGKSRGIGQEAGDVFWCDELRVLQRGVPITSTHLRQIPIRRLTAFSLWAVALRTPIEEAAVALRHRFEGKAVFVTDVDLAATDLSILRSPLELVEQRTRVRRSIISGDQLEEVARIYRAGMASRRPTERVAEHFNVSRATAARAIRRARALGMLGAALPNRGGEQND